MKRFVWSTVVSLLLLGLAATGGAHADVKGATPEIVITAPSNGAVVHSTTVTVHVAVSHFKLVPPVFLNPPKLPGDQGHIHYYLDSFSNFVATRDAAVALTHSFADLSPGPHTVYAYLATSQHAHFPGTKIASVHFNVSPSGRQPAPRPSIAIMGVQSITTAHGTGVVVHVAVHHFRLVPPVYTNPPLLPYNEGHIHYVLDSLSNFVATRDAVRALSHPWTNVSPGRHTILVYLATSRHQHVPGTNVASIQINVAPGPGPAMRNTVRILAKLPTTGGGNGYMDFEQAILAGIVALAGGAALLLAGRRRRTTRFWR
jgi:hypothetical protein